jgi:hypothetical protein
MITLRTTDGPQVKQEEDCVRSFVLGGPLVLMKRFDIIPKRTHGRWTLGATVELARGGHVTPLAKDTLASRASR